MTDEQQKKLVALFGNDYVVSAQTIFVRLSYDIRELYGSMESVEVIALFAALARQLLASSGEEYGQTTRETVFNIFDETQKKVAEVLP